MARQVCGGPGEGDGWQEVTAPVQSGVRDGRMRGLLKSTDPGSCRRQVDVRAFPGVSQGL